MRPGAVVGGRYEIERLAGRGGMGSVYRARDRHGDAVVAIKVLHVDEAAESERFAREARMLAELRHPAVVAYVGQGHTDEGEPYLVMEWLEGEDLAARLTRQGLTPEETLRLTSQVAEALAAAHARGIVHRDIKPSNLFLPDGDPARVKILDFGSARFTARAQTRTGVMIGTPGYMSPEQARGVKHVDARADIYALGCVLFECLTGRAAFAGDHVMAVLAKILLEEAPRVADLRRDVPPEIDELVARMLSKDPSLRPTDGSALVSELARIRAVSWSDDKPAPARSGPHPVLTDSEQRLVCVIAAETFPHDELGEAHTLSNEDLGGGEMAPGLKAAAAPYDARLEWLADGSMVAVLTTGGTAIDQATQAARCALALWPLLRGSMALTTGRGMMAARFPVGEVVDRAAKLLAGARSADDESKRRLLLDGVTAGLLQTRFFVLEDKGRHTLVRERPAESERALLGRATPTVGRDRELATLEAMLDESLSEPAARGILVTALPGVGKSRLRHEFLRREREHRMQVWFGRGDLMSVGSPYAMLSYALSRAFDLYDGQPLENRRVRLRARVAQTVAAAERDRVTEFMGELIGVPFPDEDSVQLRAARADAMLMGDQIRRAWEDWLAAECAQNPVVLVLEDLQWGDLPTVNLVRDALRNLVDQPFFVLALARPEVHQLFPGFADERGMQELRLGELTKKSAEKLVRAVLEDAPTDDEVAQIVEHSAGNAFYLEELIRAFAERNRTGVRRAPSGINLPDTVLAMVQTRLESLASDDRQLLRAASVFGQRFWAGGVAELLGATARAADVQARLGPLVGEELVISRRDSRFAGQTEWSFRHALVREAAYAMLTEHDRAVGHRLAGEWLERMGELEPTTLAEHYERGGERGRAAGWLRRAAEESLEANDFRAAVAHAERGVTLDASGAQRGPLRLIQAEAHLWHGEFQPAIGRALESMTFLPRGGALWCKAVSEAVLASRRTGDTSRIVSLSQQLVDAPPKDRSPVTVVALSRVASQLYMLGERELADRLFALVEDAAGPLAASDPAMAAWVLETDAFRRVAERRRLGLVLRQFHEVVRLFRQAGDIRNELIQRASLGYSWVEFGMYRAIADDISDLLPRAERLGLARAVSLGRVSLGLALARLGDPIAGEEHERVAIDDLRLAGDKRLLSIALAYLATIQMLGGDLEAAEIAAREAMQVSPPPPPLPLTATSALAQVLLAQGRFKEAIEAALPGVEHDSNPGAEGGSTRCRLVHAEALHALGDVEGAKRAIEEARGYLLTRSKAIADPDLTRAYLENPPDHARTFALAKEWGLP